MSKIVIYGYSDDLIGVDGDIRDEFSYSENGSAFACSDGTVGRIDYTDSGLWKISVVKHGSAQAEMVVATDPDSSEYSDRLALSGDIEWIVCGTLAKLRKGKSS